MTKKWHLAQINVGKIKYSQEDPRMSGFMDRLELLKKNEPCSEAFTFRTQFPSPGDRSKSEDMAPEPYCSGWD